MSRDCTLCLHLQPASGSSGALQQGAFSGEKKILWFSSRKSLLSSDTAKQVSSSPLLMQTPCPWFVSFQTWNKQLPPHFLELYKAKTKASVLQASVSTSLGFCCVLQMEYIRFLMCFLKISCLIKISTTFPYFHLESRSTVGTLNAGKKKKKSKTLKET